MSLALEKADSFLEDFTLQVWWYVHEAGEEVARRFERAVDARSRLLCEQPELGRLRGFRNSKLQGLRSFTVERPFQRVVVFYRENGRLLQAVRLMDGARDLPRRLLESPADGTH